MRSFFFLVFRATALMHGEGAIPTSKMTFAAYFARTG
jgi:hypothetical protein